MKITQSLNTFITQLSHFPWQTTASVLGQRFRQDRLNLVASSLTLTSLFALVPVMTTILVVISAFPIFQEMQTQLQQWLLSNLIPANISKTVFSYLSLFASKASRLGGVSLLAIVFSTLIMIVTIERSLNGIWRVTQRRSLTQRLFIYWALLTLGPLLVGASITMSSLAWAMAKGWFGWNAATRGVFYEVLHWFILLVGLCGLYKLVPNTPVRLSHALCGAVFATLGIELVRDAVAWYFATFSTYSALYGAFAAVPILIFWMHIFWIVVLLGAVIAAYMPSLLSGVARREDYPAWDFQIALEVLRSLQEAKKTQSLGLSHPALSGKLGLSDLQLRPALEALLALDWIAQIHGNAESAEQERYALLVDPAEVGVQPLVDALLIPTSANDEPTMQRFSEESNWERLKLSQII